MIRASVIALAVCVASPVAADPVGPPSKDDGLLITNAMQRQMSDPRVFPKNMRAAQDPTADEILWVCGDARRSGSGEQHSFIAMITSEILSEPRQVRLLRISKNPNEERVTARLCKSQFQFAREVYDAGPEVARNMKTYKETLELCLIMGRPSPTCDQLDKASDALEASGWCRAQDGIIKWARCGG